MIDLDPDNPLPEASFTWRRMLTYAASLAFWLLLFLALPRIPAHHLLAFAQSLMVVLVILWVLYFSGASADDIGRLIARTRFSIRPPAAPPPPSRRARPEPDSDLPPWERDDA